MAVWPTLYSRAHGEPNAGAPVAQGVRRVALSLSAASPARELFARLAAALLTIHPLGLGPRLQFAADALQRGHIPNDFRLASIIASPW